MKKIFWLSWLTCMAGTTVATTAAENWPQRPLRIVTSEPGGGSDFTARVVAQGLSMSLGQQVIVDNRAGTFAAAHIMRTAAADGYTLLSYNNSLWTLPLLQTVPYDVLRDFVPVTLATRSPNILVVHPSLPLTTVRELVAHAKAQPGALNYASGTIGSTNHLAAELFKALAGVNIARIGYKGSGFAVNDLIGGQVQLMFATSGSIAPHVKAGRLRALAVTSAQPSPLAPGCRPSPPPVWPAMKQSPSTDSTPRPKPRRPRLNDSTATAHAFCKRPRSATNSRGPASKPSAHHHRNSPLKSKPT